jgi:hypothetical protein
LDLSGWHHTHGVSTRRGETLVGKEEEAAVSSEEEKNKALVRRFLQADAQGDLDALAELMSPHFVDHRLLPGQEPGREGYIRAVAEQSCPAFVEY